MASKQQVQIWIGRFESTAPKDYFAAQYTEDDAPINQFAAEQGEHYFDYDWVEISYFDFEKADEVRSFVDGHSFSEQYINDVCKRAESLGLLEINVFVVCIKQGEFDSPRSASGDGYRLEYIGSFPYKM